MDVVEVLELLDEDLTQLVVSVRLKLIMFVELLDPVLVLSGDVEVCEIVLDPALDS